MLKITFTGGEQIGDEVERRLDMPVIIGRSHAADIRVREPDVSGKHLEIGRREDGCYVKVLSRFGLKLDGRALKTGEAAPLAAKSSVEIGSRLRFRVDALPTESADRADKDDGVTGLGPMTEATRAYESGATSATAFAESATFATVVGSVPSEIDQVAVGTVEESVTKDMLSMFGNPSTMGDRAQARDGYGEPPPPEPAPVSAPEDVAADDRVTADDPPNAQSASFLDGMGKSEVADAHAAETTGVGFGVTGQDEQTGSGTGVGETQEMVTRIGSLDEILERKHQMERVTAARHWRFGIYIALAFAALIGGWFATGSRKHLEDAEGPFLPDGKERDVAECEIFDAAGKPELYLEYPRNDNMQVVQSADSNEFEVVSFIGCDRDVPFRMVFRRQRDSGELQMSLQESFKRWMNAQEREHGFAFERTRVPEIEFFESEFPVWCEVESERGTTFVRAEYTHPEGETLWRGVAYRFRCGDVAYALCNEVPEAYWKRAGYRIQNNLFMGLFRGFLVNQWDSPGAEGMVDGLSEDELVARIRHEQSVERISVWPTLEKWIDTLLVRTWGKNTASARFALEARSQFLQRKSRFYHERQLAYATASVNDATKRMKSIFSDCVTVFGRSKRDRRYYLVNDPEVWKCQREE